MKILKIIPILLICLTLMACSLSVNVPTVRTGVSQTLDINEPALSNAEPNEISIEMGAGTLRIESGASNLVEGTVTYNVSSWEPEITRDGDALVFAQKNTQNVGVPDGNIKNEWDLAFGDYPIALRLATGAYDGDLDLSGLAITSVNISDGASRSRVHWETPNLAEMDEFVYKTGASDVELTGLGYANVREISFSSGVGSYTLDFSGDLQNDINVKIESGMSDMTIIIPESTHAVVTIGDGVSNVNVNGTWTTNGNTYECGSGDPTITISIETAFGNLTLRQE